MDEIEVVEGTSPPLGSEETEVTVNAKVWDEVLDRLLFADDPITIQDLDFSEYEMQTVVRTLRQMSVLGWVNQVDDDTLAWEPGQRIREFKSLADQNSPLTNPQQMPK